MSQADTPIPEKNITVTGNTIIDALFMAVDQVKRTNPEIPGFNDELLNGRRLILITGHRRESFGVQFQELCLGLRDIAKRFDDVLLVYPLHLNPQVQRPVRAILAGHPRIKLVEPLDYLAFTSLMLRSHFIITDSGGIQEEAPALGKPVLVCRNTTERPEGLAAGSARLVGTDRSKIFLEAARLLEDPDYYASMAQIVNPYGDGRAASRIVEALRF